MVELVERTELAIDEVIEVVGRATIEAVLEMSAEGIAGPKQAGKPRAEGSPLWYARQGGQVYLSERSGWSDSSHSGVRQRTRRITNWKNGSMALRWAAATFVETEKSYRRILGYRELWMLRAQLDDHEPASVMKKAG